MFTWLTTSKKGFTLVELMIVVLLLGLGFVALANMFRVTYKAYSKTEERYVYQEQVKKAAESLQDNAGIAAATGALIYPSPIGVVPAEGSSDDIYSYLWSDPLTGKVVIQDKGSTERVVITEVPLYITFSALQASELFDGGTDPAFNQCGMFLSVNALDDYIDDDGNEITDFSTIPHEELVTRFLYSINISYHFPNMVEKDANRVNMPNYKRMIQLSKEGANAVDLLTQKTQLGVVDGINPKTDHISENDTDPYVRGFCAAFITDTSLSASATDVALVPPTFKCFIATASFGVKSPDVGLLCDFRDNVLLKTTAGTWFVDKYYQYSPPIAEVIAQSPALRFITRSALKPLVWTANVVLNPEWLAVILPAATLSVTAIVNTRKKRK